MPPARTMVCLGLAAAAAACSEPERSAPDPPTSAGDPTAAASGPESPWSVLEPGLEFGEFPAPRPSEVGDSIIRMLRIDPARFELRLMNATAPGQGTPRTAGDWCRRNDLVAAINASMYQTDYRRSVSLMRTRDHTNNSRVSKDKAVLAFDPLEDAVPPVQIIDRECQDFEDLRGRYGSLVQSIRMVSCQGDNVWSPQPKKWSTAAVGVDRDGNVLFIHVRSPYSTHDLINFLLGLPIRLKNAMYAEGGPEAQLYIRAGGRELEFIGSFETGFVENDSVTVPLPVPNVVGVARRPTPAG